MIEAREDREGKSEGQAANGGWVFDRANRYILIPSTGSHPGLAWHPHRLSSGPRSATTPALIESKINTIPLDHPTSSQ